MRFIRKSKKKSTAKLDIYETEYVPTLEEVIKFLEPTHLKIMIEIKESGNIKKMSLIINELYEKYPYLYERSFCASFDPRNLYAIRLLNLRIITGFIFVKYFTADLINDAAKTSKPISMIFQNNLILRYILDELFWWLGTPRGLKLMGCNIACLENTEINDRLIDVYKQNKLVLAVWTVNTLEQKMWLKSRKVSIITDIHFD